jgi:5-formyltetrahydrofolate cyclo-ligase
MMMRLAQQRQTMRQQRQQLSSVQQANAAEQVLQQIKQHKLLAPYQHIAFYYPVGGELDTRPLMQYAWQQGKTCYLPILPLLPEQQLSFMPYLLNDELIENRYHIPEPKYDEKKIILAQQLDLVFVPLVAFDTNGNRLGMGAGFYDRTFAFTGKTTHAVRLIGLAYAFQQVDTLQPQPWDIPLTTIITEQQLCNTGL